MSISFWLFIIAMYVSIGTYLAEMMWDSIGEIFHPSEKRKTIIVWIIIWPVISLLIFLELLNDILKDDDEP